MPSWTKLYLYSLAYCVIILFLRKEVFDIKVVVLSILYGSIGDRQCCKKQIEHGLEVWRHGHREVGGGRRPQSSRLYFH